MSQRRQHDDTIVGLKVGGTFMDKADDDVYKADATCALNDTLDLYVYTCSGRAQTNGSCSGSGKYTQRAFAFDS